MFSTDRPFLDTNPPSIATEASLTGWGAIWLNEVTSDPWTSDEASLHFNVLKSRAVLNHRALGRPLVGSSSDDSVRRFDDHVYISKQGKARPRALLQVTRDLLFRGQGLNFSLQTSPLAVRRFYFFSMDVITKCLKETGFFIRGVEVAEDHHY